MPSTTHIITPPLLKRLDISLQAGLNGLLVDEVIDKLVAASWKASQKSGLSAEIQRVVNNVVLYNLMGLASYEKAAPQVRAVAGFKLKELQMWLTKQAYSGDLKDTNQKAHFLFALDQIELFHKDPTRVKLTVPLPPPPGAPIGN